MATVRIQLRRGTAAEWASVNPVLAAGEMGLETDTGDFKFGDGTSTWSALNYALGDSVDDYIPLSEKGVADGVATLDSNGFIPVSQLPGSAALDAEVNSAISTHNSDTTNVHGIANTAELETQTGAQAKADNAQSAAISAAASDATTKANTAQSNAEATAAAALSAHESDTTGIHGIADTSILVTTSGTQTLTNKTITSPSGLVKSDVGLSNVDNTSDLNKPVSTAQQTAITNAQSAAEATAAAALSSHEADTTFVHGIADTSILVTTTGTQTLSSKSLISPTLTGTPTAPTAANGTDTTQVATTEFVQNAIELVVGAAPAALDTLAEIASSLNDDADLAGTLTTLISEKVSKSGDTMSGVLSMGDNKITNVSTPTLASDAATKGYLDGSLSNGIGLHNTETINVHGISDTSQLIYDNDPRLSDVRDPADGSVATVKIADQAVTTAKINDLAITTGKIADDAVTEVKIVDDAVTTHKILDAAVLSAKIADGNVTTAKLADSSVTTAKLADTSVSTGKIVDNAVTEAKILNAAVTTAKIADTNVTTAKLADSSVTEAKLATDSVSTIKVVDLNITTAKLADGSVTEDKLATGSVTSGKIASGAVTSGAIADGAIVNSDVSASAAIAQSKIANLTTDLAAKAPTDGPTFTGTVVLPSTTSIGTVSATELGYVDGVTSAIQTQLDAKASTASLSSHESDTSTHGVGTIVGTSETQTLTNKTISSANNTITVQVANVSDLTATAAELNVLDGITSSTAELNILDGVTATAAELNVLDGITASTTELNYVDGVTSAIQTQIDGKASLSGATFTGSVEIDQNLTVDGNLTVNGTTFNASSTSIVIEDNMVQLAHQNAANTVDLGLVVGYNDGSAKHSGIVRDVSENKWKLFKGVATEPTTTVNFTEGSLDDLEVAGFTASSATIGNVSNTELQYLDGVTSSVQTQLNAKAPLAGPTFTGTVTLPSTTSIGNVSSTELGYLDGVTSAVQTQLNAKAPTASPTFTGTVTVGASGIAFTDGSQTKEGVPSRTTIIQKSASYTLSDLAERDDLIEMNSASAITLTIPANSSVAYPVGTSIDILQTGAGQVTIAGAGGVTVNATPGLKLRAQWSSATLFKRATDTWVVMGDLSA